MRPLILATTSSLALLAGSAVLRAQPAASHGMHVDVTLTTAAMRLTRGEGGGEYLRERAVVGVLNTVANLPGDAKWKGDFRPEDDVYLLVAGVAADGEPFARIIHSPDGLLWPMYKLGRGDDGDAASMYEVPLWAGDVPDGAEVDLMVAVLELDGDDAGGQLPTGERGRELARERLDTVQRVGLTLAERIARGDTLARRAGVVRAMLAASLGDGVDDVIGVAGVRVRVTGGTVQADWRALDDAKDRGHSRLTRGRPIKPRWFELTGDGAKYHAHFRVSARER